MNIATAMTNTSLAEFRLWQLMSPAFPVGMFAWSTGLEYAIEATWVGNKAQTEQWIGQQLEFSLKTLDVPLLLRFYHAWQENDKNSLCQWSEFLVAIRESKEFVEEDNQLGKTMSRVLSELGIERAEQWKSYSKINFLLMYALACVHWDIDLKLSARAYLWSWVENQVSAAMKLVPLGHLSGQRILSSIIEMLDEVVEQGMQLEDDEIGLSLPALAIASALHEQQYSRMFRS